MASADADRVSRFLDDATALCADGGRQPQKIVTEIRRLRTWLQKHQDESLVDAGKQKLVLAVECYFKLSLAVDPTFSAALGEATQELVMDLLKLPEGKLIRNAGGKSKALKWLDIAQAASSAASASSLPGSAAAKAAVAATTKWTVADVARDGTLSLISGGIDDDDDDDDGNGDARETQTREGVAMADKAAVARVRACVDGGGSVEIELDASDRIVGTRFQEQP
jgi:hypothetical protein